MKRIPCKEGSVYDVFPGGWTFNQRLFFNGSCHSFTFNPVFQLRSQYLNRAG